MAGFAAAGLCAGVALLQFGLALGAPLGEATFGGAAPTRDGVLSPGFRVIAALSGFVLILFAAVLLARAGVIRAQFLGDRAVSWGAWAIVGFLVLNTIGNFSATHPLERWVMGPISLTLVAIGTLLALRGPRRRQSE